MKVHLHVVRSRDAKHRTRPEPYHQYSQLQYDADLSSFPKNEAIFSKADKATITVERVDTAAHSAAARSTAHVHGTTSHGHFILCLSNPDWAAGFELPLDDLINGQIKGTEEIGRAHV